MSERDVQPQRAAGGDGVSVDKTARVWDLSGRTAGGHSCTRRASGLGHSRALFSPDGKRVVTGVRRQHGAGVGCRRRAPVTHRASTGSVAAWSGRRDVGCEAPDPGQAFSVRTEPGGDADDKTARVWDAGADAAGHRRSKGIGALVILQRCSARTGSGW